MSCFTALYAKIGVKPNGKQKRKGFFVFSLPVESVELTIA